MKLTHILQELSAAEQAHQKGLEPGPFGRWKKDGKVVAMTKNGKLVPVKDKKASDPLANKGGTPNHTPATMSAKQAGNANTNIIRPQDVKKTTGQGTEKVANLSGAEIPVDTPPIPSNPYRNVKPITGAIPIEPQVLEDLKKRSPHLEKQLNENVIGEKLYFIEKAAYQQFMMQTLNRERHIKCDQVAEKSANMQHNSWRSKLPEPVQHELAVRQMYWRDEAQTKRNPKEREEQNNFFNKVGKETKPTLKSPIPMERGMKIKSYDIKDFLAEFRIGHDIEIPPSGFSLNPYKAREFAIDMNDDSSGMLIRIHPNKNADLCGIHLTEVPEDMVHPTKAYDMQENESNFKDEREIIRTHGPRARCAEVSKYITNINDKDRLLYVIDLEEEGYPTEIQPVTEWIDPDDGVIDSETFLFYMNSPVKQPTDY